MNVSSLRLQKEGKEEGKKEERRAGGRDLGKKFRGFIVINLAILAEILTNWQSL